MAPIKVGIIGYGFSTKCFHLPYILPNPELEMYAFLQRAAAPSDPAQTPRWGHCTVDFPQAKHYQTADEFFGDELIELVIVLSSTAHGELTERALLAGKHGASRRRWVLPMIQTQARHLTRSRTNHSRR
jgi:predicted dehydrogenase